MLMRSTALLLGMLAVGANAITLRRYDYNHTSLDNPHNDLNKFDVEIPADMLNGMAVMPMTPNNIFNQLNNYITSPKVSDQQKLIALINEMQASDIIFNKHATLAFQHLRGFNIALYPINELRNVKTKFAVEYFPDLRTLVLPAELDNHALPGLIRYGVRQAALQAMQITLSKKPDTRCLPVYIAEDIGAEKRITYMLNQGAERVIAQRNVIIANHKNPANARESAEITGLNTQLAAINKYYLHGGQFKISPQQVGDVEKTCGPLLSNSKTNLDKCLHDVRGDILITSVKDFHGGKVVRFKFLNLVNAFLHKFNHLIISRVDNRHSLANLQINQIANVLFENFPAAIIKHFYAEFYAHTEMWLNRALQQAPVFVAATPTRMSFENLLLENVKAMQRESVLANSLKMEMHLDAADIFTKSGNHSSALEELSLTFTNGYKNFATLRYYQDAIHKFSQRPFTDADKAEMIAAAKSAFIEGKISLKSFEIESRLANALVGKKALGEDQVKAIVANANQELLTERLAPRLTTTSIQLEVETAPQTAEPKIVPQAAPRYRR